MPDNLKPEVTALWLICPCGLSHARGLYAAYELECACGRTMIVPATLPQ